MPIKSDTTLEPQEVAPSPADLSQAGVAPPPVGAGETARESAKEAPLQEISVPYAFPISLDEFCARLSSKIRRPELLGGWHAYARGADLLHAPTEVFEALFDAYLTHKP